MDRESIMKIDCLCPNCLQRIPVGTLAEWIAMYTPVRLTPCEGMVDGKACCELLTARELLRQCKRCGHNNWRIISRRKKEEAEADAVPLPHE